MDQVALNRIADQIDKEVRKRFPAGINRVVVRQYGDEPVIEPGELLVRVVIDAPEGDGAGSKVLDGDAAEEDKSADSKWADTEPDGEADRIQARERALAAFESEYGSVLKHFRKDLSDRIPEVTRLEIRAGDESGSGPTMTLRGRQRGSLEARAMAGDLTPVMARLGPEDLETLDSLITAGIAGSRAEAVRWALARIRERPAYAQLRERAKEIERLKTEF
jgi:hypothetical protein